MVFYNVLEAILNRRNSSSKQTQESKININTDKVNRGSTDKVNRNKEYTAVSKTNKINSKLKRQSTCELEESWEILEAYNVNGNIKTTTTTTTKNNERECYTFGKSKFFVKKKVEYFEMQTDNQTKTRSVSNATFYSSVNKNNNNMIKDRPVTVHVSNFQDISYPLYKKIFHKSKSTNITNHRSSLILPGMHTTGSVKTFPKTPEIIEPIDINELFNKNETHTELSDEEEFLKPQQTLLHISQQDTLQLPTNTSYTNQQKPPIPVKPLYLKQLNDILNKEHKRSHSESKKICSLTYLSEMETKQQKKVFHKRYYSIPNLDNNDDKNEIKVTQRHVAVMESLRIRKVKQKIAQRMVKVNALNLSRPRTESGQPCNSRVRCYTEQNISAAPSLLRTTSDPEFLHGRSILDDDEQLLNHDELNDNEIYKPLHNDTNSTEDLQKPVSSLISDFNRKSVIEKEKEENLNTQSRPIPKPRNRIKTEKSVEKPVPSPRPLMKSYSLESLSSVSRLSEHDMIVPNKPKVRPKPSRLAKQNNVDTLNTSQSNNELKSNNQSNNELKTNNQSNTEIKTSILIDLSDTTSKMKQNKTTPSDDVVVSPYEVVDLNLYKPDGLTISLIPISPPPSNNNSPSLNLPMPILPMLSPMKTPQKSPTNSFQYMDMSDDPYLLPIDATSPSPSPLPSPMSDVSATEIFNNTKELRKDSSSPCPPNRYKSNKNKKLKKGKSLCHIKTDNNFKEDANRRKSAPNVFEVENSLYQDMTLTKRPASSHFYESMYDNVAELSADEDDDECWASDEFDEFEDSDEGDYMEVENAVMSKPIPKLPDLDPASKKIYNIVCEILSTERAYVKRLYLLDEVFQKRLQKEEKENNIIPEKTTNEIFSNLTPIHQFHSTFLLPGIEKRVFEWTEINKIGDIFKNLGNFLKLYTVFVKNFDHSTTTISHWLKKSPKFAQIVGELQKRPECENLSLQHHMLEPIQRVPRYKLLLQDYIKRLPVDSPDKTEAEESLKIISKIALEANNSMKENEKFKKLLDIEDRILEGLKGESLVTASRVFLKEGELKKLAARKGSSTTARSVLLFSDILLCCATTTTHKLRVRQIMDVEGLTVGEDETLPPLAFRIKSRQRVLDLIARDETEKDEWMRDITDAVNDLTQKRGSLIKRVIEEDEQRIGLDKPGHVAPVWVKDEDVTMCMLCAVKFGLIHRKHHCRGCGRVTCDTCSNYRAPLGYANNEICRVCFACSKKLGLQIAKNIEENELKQSVKARDSNLTIDICGELYWKAPGKRWNKEWVVLSQFALYIQRKRQDVKAHSTLPVPGFSISHPSSHEEIESSHPHCLKLYKEDKKEAKEHKYLLSSDSKSVIERWKKHLECAVQLQTYTEE